MKVENLVGLLQGFKPEDNIIILAVNNKIHVWDIVESAEQIVDMDDVASIVEDLNDTIADAVHLHTEVEDIYAEMED